MLAIFPPIYVFSCVPETTTQLSTALVCSITLQNREEATDGFTAIPFHLTLFQLPRCDVKVHPCLFINIVFPPLLLYIYFSHNTHSLATVVYRNLNDCGPRRLALLGRFPSKKVCPRREIFLSLWTPLPHTHTHCVMQSRLPVPSLIYDISFD